jgi:hypothetical protein
MTTHRSGRHSSCRAVPAPSRIKISPNFGGEIERVVLVDSEPETKVER